MSEKLSAAQLICCGQNLFWVRGHENLQIVCWSCGKIVEHAEVTKKHD